MKVFKKQNTAFWPMMSASQSMDLGHPELSVGNVIVFFLVSAEEFRVLVLLSLFFFKKKKNFLPRIRFK
jgi:hypothetical protein